MQLYKQNKTKQRPIEGRKIDGHKNRSCMYICIITFILQQL